MNDLDGLLLDAHAKGDRPALVRLYTEAAKQTSLQQAKRFYLTHAYVFALEVGHPDASALREQLESAQT